MITIITGPSGCGKSTLIKLVMEDLRDIRFAISHTTRKKRRDEVEGREYFFVSEKEFKTMIRRRAFAEWAVVHQAFYGTSKKELEKAAKGDLILDIDVQGARQIRKNINRAVFIFILPPVYTELKKRLEQRGLDAASAIRKRLDRARQEIKSYSRFDYIVVNDRIDKAREELGAIIRGQRCLLVNRKDEIGPILESFREKKGKR